MQVFVHRHMNLLLGLGCIAGLVWPYWSWAGDWMVKAILMTATFIACFKLSIAEFRALSWKQLLPFITLRYVVIPWALYSGALYLFSPDIALGVLLIAALPAGVSSPAITHIYGGQVTLAVIITLLTTLMVPLTMPLLFSFAADARVMPEPSHLLQTLVIILVLPCAAYVALRRLTLLKNCVHQYGKTTIILLTALMLSIVVGKQREYVLSDMGFLLEMVMLSVALLSFLLWLGWISGKHLGESQQASLAVTSGFNNAALGVALAALHFGPSVIMLAVGAEIAWALLPFVMRWLMTQQ